VFNASIPFLSFVESCLGFMTALNVFNFASTKQKVCIFGLYSVLSFLTKSLRSVDSNII